MVEIMMYKCDRCGKEFTEVIRKLILSSWRDTTSYDVCDKCFSKLCEWWAEGKVKLK